MKRKSKETKKQKRNVRLLFNSFQSSNPETAPVGFPHPWASNQITFIIYTRNEKGLFFFFLFFAAAAGFTDRERVTDVSAGLLWFYFWQSAAVFHLVEFPLFFSLSLSLSLCLSFFLASFYCRRRDRGGWKWVWNNKRPHGFHQLLAFPKRACWCVC